MLLAFRAVLLAERLWHLTTAAASFSRKFFVGGISASTQEGVWPSIWFHAAAHSLCSPAEAVLREHFGRYGPLLDAVVLVDRSTGRSRGFAFVQFESAEVAAAVCADTHVLDGREVDVKPALARDANRLKVQEAVEERLVAGGVTKVFVGGLAAATNDASFRAYFSQFGELQDAVVLCEPGTRRSRGFGFCTFAAPEAVDRLFQSGPLHPLDGRMVEVKPAVPKEALPRMRGPMGNGGPAMHGHRLHSRSDGPGAAEGHGGFSHYNGPIYPAAIAHYYQQAADAYAAAAAVASSSGGGSPGSLPGAMYATGGGADGPYGGGYGYPQHRGGPAGWGRQPGQPGQPMWRPSLDGSDGGDAAPQMGGGGGMTFGGMGMMPHDIRTLNDGGRYVGEYTDGAAAMYAYGAYAVSMQQQAMAMAGARRGAPPQQLQMQPQQQRAPRAAGSDSVAVPVEHAHEQPSADGPVPVPEPVPLSETSDGFMPARQARRSRGSSMERVTAAPQEEAPT